MNIIEKIKELFRRGKTKALPEPKQENRKKRGFFERTRVTEEQCIKEKVRNRDIESALKQYFDQYEELILKYQEIGFIPDFYTVLTYVNALDGNCDINAQYEKELMEFLSSSDRYDLGVQYRKNDTTSPTFYHIQTKGYQLPSDNKMLRLYINCRKENVAQLAYWLTAYNTDPQFHLKFDTNVEMINSNRTEKIVIYTTDEQLEYHMQLINYVKGQRPDLFKGSEKTNPFMQTTEGVSYARQPKTNVFQGLDGIGEEISQSANSYIARIIKESYMAAAREVAVVEPELQFLLEPQYYNDDKLYIQNYKYINSRHHAFLVNSMESKMRYLCMQNGITIKGINDERQVEEPGVSR